MFRLGQFFGHVARGATGPIASRPGTAAQKRVVRRDVEQRTAHADGATLTLRRTTIEEIEVRPDRGAEARDVGAGADGAASEREASGPKQEGSR